MRVAKVFCSLLLVLAVLMASPGSTATIPAILTCTVNAYASRAFDYKLEEWIGPLPKEWPLGVADSSPSFEVVTKATRGNREFPIFRDHIFAGLDTSHPVIRLIPPEGQHPEEYRSVVISRDDNIVILTWSTSNRTFGGVTWVATVHLSKHKVALGRVFGAGSSFGVVAETLDCR